jgi:hypothetical protein
MTSVEQRKMVQRLKQMMTKMNSEECRSFEMIAKRDRDDEELDSLTMQQLKRIFARFFPQNSKQTLEDKWKKMTQGKE